MIEAIKSPKYRLPISSLVIDGISFTRSSFFKAAKRRHRPRTKQMFTIFEPKAFPIATSIVSSPTAEKIDTLSADSDVQKATNMKPVAVLPKPVISAILTEFVIVKSLVLSKTTNEAMRITALANDPSSSNNADLPHFNYFF
jgi:hypothetical protein